MGSIASCSTSSSTPVERLTPVMCQQDDLLKQFVYAKSRYNLAITNRKTGKCKRISFSYIRYYKHQMEVIADLCPEFKIQIPAYPHSLQ